MNNKSKLDFKNLKLLIQGASHKPARLDFNDSKTMLTIIPGNVKKEIL